MLADGPQGRPLGAATSTTKPEKEKPVKDLSTLGNQRLREQCNVGSAPCQGLCQVT